MKLASRRPAGTNSNPSRKARVSAIIPTYNRANLVAQTLDSILRQTHQADEIIVVDDGSEDNTANVLEKYKDQIRYIYQPNAGKSAALNHAMLTLKGDYVWIMDDDDIALPTALESHLSYLKARPHIDFTYSDCYYFNGDDLPSPSQKMKLGSHYPEPPHGELLLFCLTFFPFFVQGMLVPLACYKTVGPFDESLVSGEDHDMIIRLARKFRGGKITSPTFMMRAHHGVRGPSHKRYTANDRQAVLRQYDLKLFTKIRSSLGLHEYLPDVGTDNQLTQLQQRQALLKRASVMARRGLFSFTVEDLMTATDDSSCNSKNEPYSAEEHLIISQLMDIDPARLGRPRYLFVTQVGRIIQQRAPGLFFSALKGLIWSTRREIHKRNYTEAAHLLVAVLCFLVTSKLRSPELWKNVKER